MSRDYFWLSECLVFCMRKSERKRLSSFWLSRAIDLNMIFACVRTSVKYVNSFQILVGAQHMYTCCVGALGKRYILCWCCSSKEIRKRRMQYLLIKYFGFCICPVFCKRVKENECHHFDWALRSIPILFLLVCVSTKFQRSLENVNSFRLEQNIAIALFLWQKLH